MRKKNLTGALSIGVAGLALFAMTACSGDSGAASSTPTASATIAADPALTAMLPDSVKSAGTITVAGSADFAPDNFLDTDGATPIGYNIDMLHAIGDRLGVTIDFTRTDFSGVITGIQANRYEAGISFLDTKARQDAIDMVDVYTVSESFLVKSAYTGDPIPCGLNIGVGAGSAESIIIDSLSQTECVANGKQPFTVSTYPNNPDAQIALTSGREDAVFVATAPAAYSVAQSDGALKVAGDPIGENGFTGIAVTKEQPQLRDAIKAAVQSLIDDGSYAAILDKWGVQGLALKTAQITREPPDECSHHCRAVAPAHRRDRGPTATILNVPPLGRDQDALQPQRLRRPVTAEVIADSAHPLTADARRGAVLGDATVSLDTERLYLLPYGDEPAEDAQTFHADARRLYEEIDTFEIDDSGRTHVLSRLAGIRLLPGWFARRFRVRGQREGRARLLRLWPDVAPW